MAKAKATKNSADIGFEKQLWDAADVLRGNMDAADYKNVVLGLIFLKYLSDRFDERYQELVAEGYGDEEDRDCYIEENVFYVPEEARWAQIASEAHAPEIGQVIDNAMRSIERENDALKDVLPKNFARPELDKRRLGEVVDLFTNIQMSDGESEKDLLGRAYEYCLSQFASLEGKNAGEFYTPSCIVRTLVEIIQPFHGRVYDPCCGSGGMFVQSAAFVQHHGGNVVQDITVFGQESNPNTWKLAKMNLGIRGIEADLGSYNDTFSADQHKNEKFDYILANPPFNLKNWGGENLREDPRWEYGTPPTGNANFAWMQHMIWHLNGSGKIGLILANGSLSSQTSGEGDIRRAIVEDDLVEGIVAMPGQLFYSTAIPVCLWILNKHKAQTDKTLFIDAREMGTMVTRKLREFTEEDIAKVAKAFDDFRNGELEEEKGFSAIASIEDIAKQDFILTPGRYVGIAEAEGDGEPFEEKMARLAGEISKCFEESNRLQEQIKKNLEAIGYGM